MIFYSICNIMSLVINRYNVAGLFYTQLCNLSTYDFSPEPLDTTPPKLFTLGKLNFDRMSEHHQLKKTIAYCVQNFWHMELSQ